MYSELENKKYFMLHQYVPANSGGRTV